jgi:Holliday junction resolvase RusA-like endonuclease
MKSILALDLDTSVRQFAFVIHGEPVAKGRPRLGVISGHAHAYTPKKTRSYEDIVRQQAVKAYDGAPMACGLNVEATFYRGVPVSWSRKKAESAILGNLRPIGRPDLDNLFKAVTDGMNGVIYLDDAQIHSFTVRKLYCTNPRVEVMLSW